MFGGLRRLIESFNQEISVSLSNGNTLRLAQFWFGILIVVVGIALAWGNITHQCEANARDIARIEASLDSHLRDTRVADSLLDIQIRLSRIETQLVYIRAKENIP